MFGNSRRRLWWCPSVVASHTPLSAVPSRLSRRMGTNSAWLLSAGQAGLSLQLIFGTNGVGMAGNQSAEDLVMSRASARFTNFPPCFL
jgi:hypothetical protein